MDTLDSYRQALADTLQDYARNCSADGQVQCEVICDAQQNHYLLLQVGWEDGKRIHGVLLHIDILQDKLWIQYDGTERGIAEDLVIAGVPKDRIVLAFRPPQARKYTEFAAA